MKIQGKTIQNYVDQVNSFPMPALGDKRPERPEESCRLGLASGWNELIGDDGKAIRYSGWRCLPFVAYTQGIVFVIAAPFTYC